jgi:ribose/xylose/arabinose/galactoside ABC-type transport system permease subunit
VNEKPASRLRWSVAAPVVERRSFAEQVRRFGYRLLVSEYFVLYLTIAYFIILAFFVPDLISPRNISNQLSNVWPLLVVSIGQTFVILIAGIDLSLGAIMGFVSVAGAAVMATAADKLLLGSSPLWGTVIDENGGLLAADPLAVPAAIALMLAVGTLIGAFNGFAVSRLKMPPFMVTLVSLMFFASAAIWLTQSQNIINLPESFTKLGAGDIVSFYFGEKLEPQIKRRDVLPFVTYPMLIALAVAVAAHLILKHTIFGRHIYAIGTNPKAAEISGVPVKRVVTLVFAFAGFCAAVAAVLYTARLEGGRPTIGAGVVLLDIIGATVIGGTSLSGGKGKVAWTFVGVVFFVLLSNTLNYMRLSAFHIDVVKGAIILAAAFFNVMRTRLLARESVG